MASDYVSMPYFLSLFTLPPLVYAVHLLCRLAKQILPLWLAFFHYWDGRHRTRSTLGFAATATAFRSEWNAKLLLYQDLGTR